MTPREIRARDASIATIVRATEILASDSPLQYREKLARIALDEMYQFVAVLDARGTLLEVNRAALEGAGLQLQDVEGKPFWECFWWAVSDDTRQTLKESIARVARGEFVRYDVEIYGRSGGKETIVIDFSMIPVKDAGGKVVFIVPEGRDITEKKAHEREIARKNSELQALLERIRELDEIKTQFFANVSHELRTPLALIIGPAERLAKSAAGAGADGRRESAEVIVRNARMMLKHVNDLLDISKLEAGKLDIELHNTEVAGLVRLTASHFAILAADRQVDFQVNTPPVVMATVDSSKLQRVLMNLLSNAFKFVGERGTIRCTLELAGAMLVLTVEDSGPGVKPALRKAIFERFRQGVGDANRQFSGTGLGLAIAHEFVELHKGTIKVLDSRLGGALLRVELPALSLQLSNVAKLPAGFEHANASVLDGLLEELRGPTAASADASKQPDDNQKSTVLVVEDNAEMNLFIAQALSKDYRVITAFDGREGLAKALAMTPDLIVSDLMMPDYSGAEMVAALRTHRAADEVPVILLSAKADEELKNRLLSEGAQDYITKPFSELDLLVRARNLIAVKQSRDALRTAEADKRQAVEAANLQLKTRNEELGQLFQQAPGFMAVLRGPAHVFDLANTAFFKLIGQRDVIGKSVVAAMPELAAQGFVQLLDSVMKTGQPFIATGRRVKLERVPGGPLEQLYVDFINQPLFASDGSITGIFVQGHDVTEQRRAEESLRAADRRKDEFLATLAHELRNPLAPIRHAAAISRAPLATAAQIRWSQDVVERQVGYMSRLLDDLLDVSRITRGSLELRKERISLNEALTVAVETARPLIESKGHELIVTTPPATGYVDADPVRFTQIFTNLLTNAAKYTDFGGVIRLEVEHDATHAFITVRDNGIGIASEVLPHVFEMFSQATSALERSAGGLGIGLALVRGLVRRHGGSIEARSAGIGKGSEFVVTLPLARPELSVLNPPVETALEAGGRQRLRVLVADDNRDNANTCAMLLEMSGHEVKTTYDGSEAVEAAARFMPHIALLDIGMPVLNGYEAARKIRAQPGGSEVVLVAITGWGQEEDRKQALGAGFDHHLAKPVDFKALHEIFARYGEKRLPSS